MAILGSTWQDNYAQLVDTWHKWPAVQQNGLTQTIGFKLLRSVFHLDLPTSVVLGK